MEAEARSCLPSAASEGENAGIALPGEAAGDRGDPGGLSGEGGADVPASSARLSRRARSTAASSSTDAASSSAASCSAAISSAASASRLRACSDAVAGAAGASLTSCFSSPFFTSGEPDGDALGGAAARGAIAARGGIGTRDWIGGSGFGGEDPPAADCGSGSSLARDRDRCAAEGMFAGGGTGGAAAGPWSTGGPSVDNESCAARMREMRARTCVERERSSIVMSERSSFDPWR